MLLRIQSARASVIILIAIAFTSQSAELPVTTTWLGNSFSGGGRNTKWVQNFMFTSAVNRNGRVFTASHWDEAHRESGIYENGDVIGNCAKAIGEAVAVNETRVFVGAGKGVKQFTFDGQETGKFYALSNIPRYLAANSTTLVVVDAVADQILLLDIETGKMRASWPVHQPGALAISQAGDVWVTVNIQRQAWDGRYWVINTNEPARIVHFSSDGQKLSEEITGDTPDWKPTALSWDAKGRLMVGDDGPRHQVLFFDVASKPQPKSVATFGAKGGIGSGTPGVAEPDKFWSITGVGTDKDENVFVTLNEQGCVLRKFTPEGKLVWELANHIFVDAGDFDPVDETQVYAKQEHFVFDYAQAPGKGWRLHSHTLDATRFPEDPRLWMANDGHALVSPFMRRLNGNLYMYLTGMSSENLAIYRFDGEIAVPCGLLLKKRYQSRGAPNYPPHQPEKGEWIWRDSNGDGRFQANEFEQPNNPQSHAERWNWWVDAKGDIWTDVKEGMRKFPLQGFDAQGNPIYTFASAQIIPAPAPFNRISRMEYHPETDTLFVSGYTPERPYNGRFWKEAGRLVARYDNWAKGNRIPRWTNLWHWVEGGREQFATPHSFAVAGNYMHVGYFHRGGPVLNRVYNATTGALVGEMRPGSEVNRVIGDIDAVSVLRAAQRKSGEQIILQEDDRYGKIVMFRWIPKFKP